MESFYEAKLIFGNLAKKRRIQIFCILREGVKKNGEKRSGWPHGLTLPPPPKRRGQENVKNFHFDFRLKILIIYDSKRILPKK